MEVSKSSSAARPPARRATDYTARELMVVAAAREIADGELVFVGMRLPLLAFVLAKRTHAPRAVALFENGVIRERPTTEMLITMGDAPNLHGATQLADMQSVMGLLQQGRVDVGLLGGAQVDRFGNLNTTAVTGDDGRTTRLPGSGGACDIACLARRTVIVMPHERRRFPERVDYLTSPGHGDGGDWRERVGLPAGGPSAVITDRAVLRFGDDGEAKLASRHPGQSEAEVRAHTGWVLRTATGDGRQMPETEPPTVLEVNLLRELDPDGFWTRGTDGGSGGGGS
jgi:glutaconate CoA-transferase subunit B